MNTNAAAHKWRTSLAWSAVFRVVGLTVFGLMVWRLLFAADESAWKVVSLVAVLAFAALAGVTWYLLRARVERRLWAALDQYAEQELANRPDDKPAAAPPR
jgi:hypothetical protein